MYLDNKIDQAITLLHSCARSAFLRSWLRCDMIIYNILFSLFFYALVYTFSSVFIALCGNFYTVSHILGIRLYIKRSWYMSLRAGVSEIVRQSVVSWQIVSASRFFPILFYGDIFFWRLFPEEKLL